MRIHSAAAARTNCCAASAGGRRGGRSAAHLVYASSLATSAVSGIARCGMGIARARWCASPPTIRKPLTDAPTPRSRRRRTTIVCARRHRVQLGRVFSGGQIADLTNVMASGCTWTALRVVGGRQQRAAHHSAASRGPPRAQPMRTSGEKCPPTPAGVTAHPQRIARDEPQRGVSGVLAEERANRWTGLRSRRGGRRVRV